MSYTRVSIELWSELDCMDFLIDQELLNKVNVGLVNGKQLCAMNRAECAAAVEKDSERDAVGAKLFSAIRAAKMGVFAQGQASAAAPAVPPSPQASKNPHDYQLLEDLEMQSSVQLNPEAHRFPPLFERPGWFASLTIGFVTLTVVACCTVLSGPLAKLFHFEDREEFVMSFLRHASIPILMVPFTYAHIWLALWLTFYPLHYRGCLQIPGTNMGLGWQGIVPFKSVEMAKMAVSMMTAKLIKVEEVFGKLDTGEFAKVLEPEISKQMARVVDDIAKEEAPRVWAVLPNAVKAQVLREAARNAPKVIDDMIQEMQARIEECFDLEGLVVSIMTGDLELSNNMFIQCSDRELAFIRNSGAWMGFVFGLGQMFISMRFTQWWVLPLVGCIAGAITNWFALLAIFKPVNPVYVCGGRVKLQGLFLTRQDVVSELYGHIVQSRILTAENLNRALMQGSRSHMTRKIAQRHVRAAFDKSVGFLRTGPLSMTLPASTQVSLDRIGDKMAKALSEDMYSIMRVGEDFMTKSFDLENTLRTRMKKLPPKDFERLLHPIFEQDEPKLVVAGGVLGIVFGMLQVYLATIGVH